MAKVLRGATGYDFIDLNTIGKQLVNRFQRFNPDLCKPSDDPSYRFIRFGTPKQNRMLENLVTDVKAQDPNLEPPSPLTPRRRIG
jgi:hypothetical protein